MKDNFKQLILYNIKKDMVFNNPKKGTTTIIEVTSEYIKYRRKNSDIKVKLNDLDRAYKKFCGYLCSSNDLKDFNKYVFSTKDNGHDCNCTFFFIILQYLKLSTKIKGKGVRGQPFYVYIE